jgi:hypothetical protein
VEDTAENNKKWRKQQGFAHMKDTAEHNIHVEDTADNSKNRGHSTEIHTWRTQQRL